MNEAGVSAVAALAEPARHEIAAPTAPLRLLLVEDCEADALLLLRELRRGGYDTTWHRVDTPAELANALRDSWDVITCDWKMPGFGAPQALAQIEAAAVDVPVIIVSGEVGEEFAVTAMRAGARDFVGKQRLARLVPAVARELREVEERRARKRAEAALRAVQERYRALIENASDQVAVVDVRGIYQYVSPSHVESSGFTPEELLGTNSFDLVHPDDVPMLTERLAQGLLQPDSVGVAEFRIRHKDGSWRVIETAVQNLLDDPLIRGVLVNGRDVTARRRMEDTLRLQGAIMANLAEGVALIRVSDRAIVHANPKLEEMFGYRPGALLGQHADVLDATGAEGNPTAETIAAALHRVGEWSGEVRGRRRDGSELWTRVCVSTFDHPDHGEVWITAYGDITEQKRVDAALRRSEEHMRLAMGAAPIATWEWDLVEGKLYWSDGVWDMMGLPREATPPSIGAFMRVVHPDDRATIEQKIQTVTAQGDPEPFELRILWPDGTVRWLLAHGRSVRDRHGAAIRMVGVNLDITDRRRAQTALARERERLIARVRGTPEVQATALAAAAIAIVITDRAGNIVWANPAFTRLTGYALDEVLGRNPRFLKSEVQDAAFYDRIWRTIAGGEVWEGQLVNRRKDGGLYSEEMTITPIHADDGAITHFIAVKQDVTERLRDDEQRRRRHGELETRVAQRTAALEATNRELEAFSYSISHDLRAPLRGIDGFSQALLDDFGAQIPSEARHYLENIRAAAQRMGGLISSLLNLSRLGRQELVRRSIDTAVVVREVLEDLSPLAAGRHLDVRVGALPPCHADATLLRQVWLNLIDNAFKYTAPRAAACIEIGSRREGNGVVYFVRDNGTGFDPRDADRLFGVFQRLHGDEFEGSGVGLAIVQRIVHRHGGRVWADGVEDDGATFSFTLECGA